MQPNNTVTNELRIAIVAYLNGKEVNDGGEEEEEEEEKKINKEAAPCSNSSNISGSRGLIILTTALSIYLTL